MAVDNNALDIKAAGLSEQVIADAVELVLMGEPDRAKLCLSVTFRRKP